MLFQNPRVIKKEDKYATHIGYAYEGERMLSLVVIDDKLIVMSVAEVSEWDTVHYVKTPKF